MLGILLIYFIGKHFYDLAIKFNKSKWGFAILGVISYYAGTFIGGIIIVLIYEYGMSKSIDTMNDFVLSLIALPFGILACWLFHYLLKNTWTKSQLKQENEKPSIQDIGKY